MEDGYCLDCKRMTEVVVHYSAGDAVCIECGLVTESYCIDERPEWRVFANDSGDGADPDRVGGVANPLLEDAPLGTLVKNSKGTTGDFLTSKLQRWGAPNPSPSTSTNRNLMRGFEAIADMCEQLGLVATIKNRASEIFKKVEDRKASCRFLNRNALLAASLYLACKQEGKNRTLKEICSVSNGLTIKDIGRAEKYIAKQVPDMEIGVVQSGSVMMSRFGYYLGLNHPAIKAAQETVGKSHELLDIRRNPVSIAAAVIYMISQLSDDKKSSKMFPLQPVLPREPSETHTRSSTLTSPRLFPPGSPTQSKYSLFLGF